MSQKLMKVSGVYIQLKAYIQSAYWLLFEQSYFYSQIYETLWKFVMRNQSDSKNTSYTNIVFYLLHFTGFSYSSIIKPFYCILWKFSEKYREELLFFKTLFTDGFKAIIGLISIKFYLQKLGSKS